MGRLIYIRLLDSLITTDEAITATVEPRPFTYSNSLDPAALAFSLLHITTPRIASAGEIPGIDLYLPFVFPQYAVLALDEVQNGLTRLPPPESDRVPGVIDLRQVQLYDREWFLRNGHRPIVRDVVPALSGGGRQIELDDGPDEEQETQADYQTIEEVMARDVPWCAPTASFFVTYPKLNPGIPAYYIRENWRKEWQKHETYIEQLCRERQRDTRNPCAEIVLPQSANPRVPPLRRAAQSVTPGLTPVDPVSGRRSVFVPYISVGGVEHQSSPRNTLENAYIECEVVFARLVNQGRASRDDFRSVRVIQQLVNPDGSFTGPVGEYWGSLEYVRRELGDRLFYVVTERDRTTVINSEASSPQPQHLCLITAVNEYDELRTESGDNYEIRCYERTRRGIHHLETLGPIAGLTGPVPTEQWIGGRPRVADPPAPPPTTSRHGQPPRISFVNDRLYARRPHYSGDGNGWQEYPRWIVTYPGRPPQTSEMLSVQDADAETIDAEGNAIWFRTRQGAIRFTEEMIAWAASDGIELDPTQFVIRCFRHVATHGENDPIRFTRFVRHPSCAFFRLYYGEPGDIELPTMAETLEHFRLMNDDLRNPDNRHRIEQFIHRPTGTAFFAEYEVSVAENGQVQLDDEPIRVQDPPTPATPVAPQEYPFIQNNWLHVRRPSHAQPRNPACDPTNFSHLRQLAGFPTYANVPFVDETGCVVEFMNANAMIVFIEDTHATLLNGGWTLTGRFGVSLPGSSPGTLNTMTVRTLEGYRRHPEATRYHIDFTDDEWRSRRNLGDGPWVTFHDAVQAAERLYVDALRERFLTTRQFAIREVCRQRGRAGFSRIFQLNPQEGEQFFSSVTQIDDTPGPYVAR